MVVSSPTCVFGLHQEGLFRSNNSHNGVFRSFPAYRRSSWQMTETSAAKEDFVRLGTSAVSARRPIQGPECWFFIVGCFLRQDNCDVWHRVRIAVRRALKMYVTAPWREGRTITIVRLQCWGAMPCNKIQPSHPSDAVWKYRSRVRFISR